jgi:glutamyl-tRNA reductase
MEVVLCGVNHRSAPVEFRERLALDREATLAWLRRASSETALSEVAILATCNRTEIYGVADAVETAAEATRELLSQLASVDTIDDAHLYAARGHDAARHAMRVACGLDALVIGERQVLGQVKEAYAMARAAGSLGARLDRLFTATLRAAKRVHTETALGAGAVSVASAAIVLAEKVLGTIADRRVLVIGAGDTATLAARHLAKHAPSALLIANRTGARARALASLVGGRAIGFEQFAAVLTDVDLAVCATSAPDHVITAAMVTRAQASSQGHDLVLIDLGVPRNIDPASASVDNVFVYALDALSAVVHHSLVRRQRETIRAESLIDEEVGKFGDWVQSQAALPLLRELHEHFERVRADEVRRSLKHFSPEHRFHVEQLTKALVNKLLQAPAVRLKTVDPATRPGRCWADTVRGLFGLGTPAGQERSTGG